MGVGEVAVWVREGGGEARLLELAETVINPLRGRVKSSQGYACASGVCVCQSAKTRGGGGSATDGEAAALEFWYGPLWSPTARRPIMSPRGSTRTKGMNKLKLWSERFQRAPRLSKMLSGWPAMGGSAPSFGKVDN